MFHNNQKLIFQMIAILCVIFLVSCNKGNENAAPSIEAYIQALSDKDSAKVSNLSCTDWEQYALTEVDSLTAVGSKVENLTCEETGSEGDLSFITCAGSIALDYDGEIQQIDLSTRTYIARFEDGEWRMCGYK